jgi:hypothetical protein
VNGLEKRTKEMTILTAFLEKITIRKLNFKHRNLDEKTKISSVVTVYFVIPTFAFLVEKHVV